MEGEGLQRNSIHWIGRRRIGLDGFCWWEEKRGSVIRSGVNCGGTWKWIFTSLV